MNRNQASSRSLPKLWRSPSSSPCQYRVRVGGWGGSSPVRPGLGRGLSVPSGVGPGVRRWRSARSASHREAGRAVRLGGGGRSACRRTSWGPVRTRVERVVRALAVDDPCVAWSVPQVRRFVARRARVRDGNCRVRGFGVVAVRAGRVGVRRNGVNHLLKVGRNARSAIGIRTGMAVSGQPEIEYGR